MTDVFARARQWFYAVQLWSSGSAVVNVVSDILGGYWIILLAEVYSAFSVLGLSACPAILHAVLSG